MMLLFLSPSNKWLHALFTFDFENLSFFKVRYKIKLLETDWYNNFRKSVCLQIIYILFGVYNLTSLSYHYTQVPLNVQIIFKITLPKLL